MNILWLSHNVPYPPIGGVLQRNFNLIKEVASLHKVYLIAFNQKALLPTSKDIDEARTALEKLCAHVEVLPIPSDASMLSWYSLVFRSLFSKYPYTINWLKARKMHHAIQKIIQYEKIDLVHYDTISLAEYLNDTGNLPKVLNHHNIESAMMLRRASNEGNVFKKIYFYIEGRKLRNYEENICSKFDANLVVSDLDREILFRLTQTTRIEVVPNGVDVDFFQPHATGIVKHSLIFSGRLNSYPNRAAVLSFIRKVWPLLKMKVQDLRLTIAGKNPFPELLEIANRESNIEVTGFVDDIRPFLDRAEVYVCPLWDGGGTRLKILDAMAMGKAVVSTSVGCEGIDVSPEKNILVANSPEEFVDQIQRIFNDKGLRISLGREARKLVEEKYSWKMIGSDLSRIYESLT